LNIPFSFSFRSIALFFSHVVGKALWECRIGTEIREAWQKCSTINNFSLTRRNFIVQRHIFTRFSTSNFRATCPIHRAFAFLIKPFTFESSPLLSNQVLYFSNDPLTKFIEIFFSKKKKVGSVLTLFNQDLYFFNQPLTKSIEIFFSKKNNVGSVSKLELVLPSAF